eukprot:1573996-Rhodomonas_salina.1
MRVLGASPLDGVERQGGGGGRSWSIAPTKDSCEGRGPESPGLYDERRLAARPRRVPQASVDADAVRVSLGMHPTAAARPRK